MSCNDAFFCRAGNPPSHVVFFIIFAGSPSPWPEEIGMVRAVFNHCSLDLRAGLARKVLRPTPMSLKKRSPLRAADLRKTGNDFEGYVSLSVFFAGWIRILPQNPENPQRSLPSPCRGGAKAWKPDRCRGRGSEARFSVSQSVVQPGVFLRTR